jgi:hypothetical protein
MHILCADHVDAGEGNIESIAKRDAKSTAESENLGMRGNSNRENIESPSSSQGTFYELWERLENVSDGKPSVNEDGQSDSFVVLTTTANNGRSERPAESDEGRELAERNIDQDASHRTQNRNHVGLSGLMGVREAARPISRSTQGKSRMSKRSSTDLCGGPPAMAVPTATSPVSGCSHIAKLFRAVGATSQNCATNLD